MKGQHIQILHVPPWVPTTPKQVPRIPCPIGYQRSLSSFVPHLEQTQTPILSTFGGIKGPLGHQKGYQECNLKPVAGSRSASSFVLEFWDTPTLNRSIFGMGLLPPPPRHTQVGSETGSPFNVTFLICICLWLIKDILTPNESKFWVRSSWPHKDILKSGLKPILDPSSFVLVLKGILTPNGSKFGVGLKSCPQRLSQHFTANPTHQ